MKNYLYFAERNGVEIRPSSEVLKIMPLSEDGGEGYEIIIKETLGKNVRQYSLRSRGVVLSAGVMGTVPMLLKCGISIRLYPIFLHCWDRKFGRTRKL